MSEFDWNELGRSIRDLVQDAVNSQDYEKLSSNISRVVQQTMDGVEVGVREAGRAAGRAVDEAARNLRQQAQGGEADKSSRNRASRNSRESGRGMQQQVRTRQTAGSAQTALFFGSAGRKAGGTALAVIGYGLTAILGFVFLLVLMAIAGSFFIGIEILWALVVVGVPLAGSIFLGVKGSLMLSQVRRFQSYVRILGGRAFCGMQELADAAHRDLNYVRRDVRQMIEKNWFLEGHLDKQETCLMVTNDSYRQYLQAERQRELRLRQEQEQAQTADSIPGQVQDVLEAGEAYIKRIRKCNDEIPGEEISAKIFRVERLVQQIFDRVKEHPESVSDIRRMMEYYLPTTVKLLDAYAQLDAQEVQGEHIASSKREIEEALDTLNVAFEKLLDSLFRDTAWDVSSDISVLETLLAQEGLTEKEFRRDSQ